DPVEGGGGGGAQQPVALLGGEVGVGGDHGEHGGQGGGEHAGALGHAAVGVAVAPAEGGLGDAVGGADPVGGVQAAVPRGRGDGGVHPGQQFGHGQPLADQAGGADQDLGGGVAQGVGGPLGGGVRVGESGGAGAGVGAAGVEQYGADPAALG